MDLSTLPSWIVLIFLANEVTFCGCQKTPRFDRDNVVLSRTTNPYYGNNDGTSGPNVTPRTVLGHEFDSIPMINHLQECEVNSRRPCNVTNAERCVHVRGRSPQCLCLPGHIRGPDGQTCTAVKSFHLNFPTLIPYDAKMEDRTSMVYRNLEFQIRGKIFKAIRSSNLSYIAQDVRVRQFLLPKDGYASFDLEIFVSRSFSPTAQMVQESLRGGLRALLRARGNSVYLDDTMIMVDAQMVKAIEVMDPDPCQDPLLNYCHSTAQCIRTERSFTCRCPDNHLDKSPDKLRFPGEECQYQCNCANEGVCRKLEDGQRICLCVDWWFGNRCEINGKALLIAFFLVFGLFLVFGIGLCTFCCCNEDGKRPPSSAPSSDKSGSKSIEDLPLGLDILYLKEPYYASKGSYKPFAWRPNNPHRYDMAFGTYDIPRVHQRPALTGLPQLTYPAGDRNKSTRDYGSQLKRSQYRGDFQQ